ncbi:MAG: DUF2069 domain-containing protein [Xanthomonadales bacterium]|nr:DUF2069 domain-containing protein [Xanthomonadales bacterium]
MTLWVGAVLLLLAGIQVALHHATPILLALALVPAIGGLLLIRRGQPNQLVLAGVFTLIYFIHGATEWAVGASVGLAALEVTLCTVLYISLVFNRARRRRTL